MWGIQGVKGLWPAALCALLLLIWILRPIGMEAPRQLETPFDSTRAIASLATILGDQRPHPADSDANDAVLTRLLNEIKRAGFTPEIRERFHCNDIREGAAICARTRNVLFWITAPGKDAVMLAAHYDSVPAGPGAADDGMGVAVAIEVARQLKLDQPKRPMLVLITDAEEAGLVGAAAFAAHDPLARQIGAVVNLEARGTTGAASMFQTSSPNGRDVAALQAGGIASSANSLASDLYRILPNDTDLTMLLPLGVDAANYAIIGAGTRYHTPLDDLAHLDPRSVRQMGASALLAMRGFGAGDRTGPEGNNIFTDLGHRTLLVLSQLMAGLVLALGLVATGVLVWRGGRAGRVKALVLPPVALIAGTGLAIGLGFLIAALRPELAYGTAWPIAPRAVFGAAALLGASLAVHLMRAGDGVRVAAATWLWLTALVALAFAYLPGLATLTAWPLLLVALATLASFKAPIRKAVPWLLLASAAIYALVGLPLAGGIEDGLFVEHAAPASLMLVFLYLFLMPERGPQSRLAPAFCAAALCAALAAALLVPAYSRDAPRHLTLVHEDNGTGAAFVIADNGPLPEAMTKAATFAEAPDAKGNWRAAAPRLSDDGKLAILSDTTAAGLRTIVFKATSPLADRQEFYVERGEGVRSVTVNGARPRIKGPLQYVGCTGRSCRELEVTLTLDAKSALPRLQWHRQRYGAGSAAAKLVAARPDTAQPVHVGDRQTLIRPVNLAGGLQRSD